MSKDQNNSNKNCNNCVWNDNGLCDMKGILIEDDDSCNKWATNDTKTITRVRLKK